MDTVFKKEQWACFMQQAFAAGEYDRVQDSACVLALIEIREALEEETRVLAGEQYAYDGSALAKLGHDVTAAQDTVKAVAHVVKDLLVRIEALEVALQSVIDHQGETAKLLTVLAERIDRMETGRRPELPGEADNTPTAG